jgi:5S rRNA maturation endonuclease (ribonuclease M5)
MTTMTKSNSYNQHQLKVLCDKLCDNIEPVLSYFNLEYRLSSKMVIMNCPVHGGDNHSALNLYHQGDQYRGNWVCRTHNCEKFFKNSILGFIRGVLSHQQFDWQSKEDKSVSFAEAVDVAIKLIGEDIGSLKTTDLQNNKNAFSNVIKHLSSNNDTNLVKIDSSIIKKSLQIPAKYFIDRGYCSKILNKYDIGLCSNPEKEMYQRAVAPIYDYDHKYMIGCTGRSIFEQCCECKKYHDPKHNCPTDNSWKYSKWKHSNGFKADSVLYNYWFAKDHILKSSTAIIVESPGNVWKLEEAGFHNSVGIFGSSLSDRQKILIDGSGAMNLILLTDNDDAGNKAAEQIRQKCEKTYKVYRPSLNASDVSCMTIEEIKNLLNPIIQDIL